MADYVDVNVKNPATGSTELNNSFSTETENKLQNLLNKIEKPSEENVSLSSLDSVIGAPDERQINLDNLSSPPEDWIKIFSTASNADIQKMAASIYQYGLLHRITVWQRSDDNFMILGGMTRTAAFKYLYEVTGDKKWSVIPAKVYSANQLDEIDAKRIFIVSNTDARKMTAKNISFAYYNLIKLEKQRAFYGSGIFSRDAAAKQANVSPTTFNNYLKLVELYPPLLEEIDNNNFQMMAAYEVAFLDQDLQKYICDKKYYLDLNRKTAKILKTQAKNFSDIDRIISEQSNAESVFKYQVVTADKLPDDCEILPVFVNKNRRTDILKIFTDAINSSELSKEVKDILFKSLSIE